MGESPDANSGPYGLPPDYVPNPSRGITSHREPYWTKQRLRLNDRYQYGVYRLARTMADEIGARTVLDLGCGPASKLNRFFDERFHLIGVDTGEAVALCRRLHRRGDYVILDLDDPGTSVAGLPAPPDPPLAAKMALSARINASVESST